MPEDYEASKWLNWKLNTSLNTPKTIASWRCLMPEDYEDFDDEEEYMEYLEYMELFEQGIDVSQQVPYSPEKTYDQDEEELPF